MVSLALPNAGSIAELFGVVELGDLTPMPMDSDGLAPIVDLSIYVRVGAGRGAGHGLFVLFSFSDGFLAAVAFVVHAPPPCPALL